MRTRAEAQARHDRLLIGCNVCCESRSLEARKVCRAFRNWRIEELQRAGFFACACDRPPAVMLYTQGIGTLELQVERWADEGPSARGSAGA
jgi:hypothetical protein